MSSAAGESLSFRFSSVALWRRILLMTVSSSPSPSSPSKGVSDPAAIRIGV